MRPEPNPKEEGFLAYLHVINRLTRSFKVIEAPDLTPVGPPFVVEMDKHLRELSKINSDKYELDPLEPNQDRDPAARRKKPFTLVEEPDEGKIYPRYQLFSVGDKKVLICFNTARATARSPEEQKLCKEGGATFAGNKAPAVPYPPCRLPREFLLPNSKCSATLKFSVRSAGDVVHFLGDLVWLQENTVPSRALHNPVTLGYCDEEPIAGCDDSLFNIVRETPYNRGRLRVPYRGEYYTVPNSTPDDHTLQVLAITSQLINLNKSAKELRSTPTVQIVP